MGRFVKIGVTTAAYAAVGLGAFGLLGCDSKSAESERSNEVVVAAAQTAPEEPAQDTPEEKKEPELDPAAQYQPEKVDVEPPKTFGKKNASIPDWPDVTLVDQDGKEVNFYDDLVKGKLVVINFFYATCDGT